MWILKLLKTINIEFSCMTATRVVDKDKLCVNIMDRKSQNSAKTQRKKHKAQYKGFIDRKKDIDGGG